ncbi:MAG: cell filamentation protein Fic, partial [Oscillospiraceae bacterium]|nr:cell filamentation protein Fic [Oscillospiraceae bacterium]
MRVFDFKKEYQKLLAPEVVALLSQIHEHKGQQNLFIEAKKDVLSELLEIAKIQSTEASNRIEGIITTDDRLKKIVRDKTMPKNRSEREIAGYRDVLSTIHDSYDYIPARPGMILQLHRDLYKYSGSAIGGNFKNSDNVISEELPDGTKRIRFQPVPAWETAEAMTMLCDALNEALGTEE